MNTPYEDMQEFYEECIKGKYNITLEQCREICASPFKLFKKILNGERFISMRFKYFGTFNVSKRRVFYMKKNLIKSYQRGDTSEEVYLKTIKSIEDYEKIMEKSED